MDFAVSVVSETSIQPNVVGWIVLAGAGLLLLAFHVAVIWLLFRWLRKRIREGERPKRVKW